MELVNATDLTTYSPTTININDTNGNSKDIDVDVDNDLNYDGNTLIYAFRTFTSIAVSDPLSIITFPLVFGGKSIRIDTKWKPSTVSSTSNFFTFNASDSAGTLGIDITEENLEFDLIKIRDGAGTLRNISADQSGKILYNNSNLASESYVNSQITANALQANLPLQINSGIIQSLFKPTAVTAPNTITLTANDLTGALNIEPVPDNLEFTTIKLKDGSNVVRDITSNTAGNLFYNSNEIPFKANTYTSITTSRPLESTFTSNNGLSLSLSSLWKPSTVSSNTLTLSPLDFSGTLQIDTNDAHEFQDLKISNGSTTFSITHNATNNLEWDGNEL